MSAAYWGGFATPFLIAAALGLVLLVLRGLLVLRAKAAVWRPRFTDDPMRRAREAAALAIADRFLVLRLPGGRIIAWRRTVNDLSDPARQTYAHVYDALMDAAADPHASRDAYGARYYGGRDMSEQGAFE
ncbi:hypothetical protein CHO01_36960 [Cellulomonas hominis]|uniref:Uncharacterized protein n=1 Tax=Cellulomonas hominis TaxID=156981 RepID=A0A511FH75_9CELL|nr:hypothetical protein [Cellulomonas hominis]MBB5474718.1 hypothetical protein [Cellulomonas hominis]NKY05983.1 hypothetical protein [Cellulomonas hominis]GEL48580.1 hypothetical protein CHO01_36960 [Cellulomonas hominis]